MNILINKFRQFCDPLGGRKMEANIDKANPGEFKSKTAWKRSLKKSSFRLKSTSNLSFELIKEINATLSEGSLYGLTLLLYIETKFILKWTLCVIYANLQIGSWKRRVDGSWIIWEKISSQQGPPRNSLWAKFVCKIVGKAVSYVH